MNCKGKSLCSAHSGIGNHHFLRACARLRSNLLNCLHHRHCLWGDGSEHNVLAIEPVSLHCAQEELRAIGVGTSVCHGQDSWTSVLQLEVLVSEFCSIDGLASCAIVICEITTLAHEVRDDAMEAAAFEAEALLPSAQGTEILGCLWHNILPELHDDLACRRAANGHVKEDFHHGIDVSRYLATK